MKRQWKAAILLVVAVLATVLFSLLTHSSTATAANPTTMSFQGKVVNADGTNVTDGTYSFLFKLYTVGSGGSAVWTETQSSVTVTAGVFQVDLGSSCSFFVANACNNNTPIDFNANPALYLGITFNSDPAGEMNPRVQLQSVPFAFNADRVGGLQVSQLVQLSPGSQQTGFINVSGASTFGNGLTVTTGGTTIGGTLTVTSNAAGSNAALLQGAASATVPTLVLKAGVTPGTGADILQFQSSSAVLGNVQSDGVLSLAGSAGTLQYQNAITALGDKLGLYSSSVFGRYGLGIQANTLVAYIGASSAAFAIKIDPGSGQASSAATSVFSVSGTGIVTVGNTGLAGVLQSASGQNLSVKSQGAGQLNLDSANGTLGLGTATTTIQRTAATGLNIDLNDGGLTTLTLKNSGAGVANLNLFDGSLQTGSTPTTRLDNAGNLTNIGTIGAAGGTFNVNAGGDVTGTATAVGGVTSTTNGGSGLGTSANLIVASAAGFTNGYYVQVNDTNCGGTGINPCYAKITGIAGNTLTISPALKWTTGKTVNEYRFQEIGGTETAQTLENRYGRGYFISGVATGNGTTYYNEDSISSSLTSFDLLNTGVTTLNIGGAATAITIGAVGTTTNIAGALHLTTAGGIDAGTGSLQGNSLSINGGAFAVNSSGAITALTGIATTGGYIQSGATANTLTGATTFSAAGTALTVTNAASVGSLTVTTGGAAITGTTAINTSGTAGTSIGNATGALTLAGPTTITGSLGVTGASTFTGNIATLNGNILIQQTAAGASAIFDDVAGKIGSIKAGSAKIAFLFDNTGNFSIGSDTRTNIAASNTPGTDVLTILGASGNVGLGDTTPVATLTVGAGDLFQVAGASGNVLTAGTITGTTLNGTTGINTGAGAGTQRIDASGNIVNAGNFTSAADTTFTTTGANGFAFKPGTNNATTFEIQKADGTPLFMVDSTSINLLTNPGFEIGITGWSAKGSSTPSQNVTVSNTYHGIASLQVITGTVANNGVSTNAFTQTVAAGTYTLSFYAKLSAGTLTTIRAGYNQGAGDVACTLNSAILIIGGFQRYTCTFTTTANMSTLWIDQGANTTSRTVFIDAVQLQTGSTATAYQIGKIQIRGVVTNPISLQNTSDSTTAFQVVNAAGTANTFTVDTVNGRANVSTGFSVAGVAGSTLTVCGGSQYIGAAKLTGGIITAGVCTNDATGLSDIRAKTNINSLGSVLDSIRNVGAYSFNYRCNDPQFVDLNLSCDKQTGVIAQELQQIFPDLVSERDDGYLQVDYRGLSVYTLQAVTELAKHIDGAGNADLNVVTAKGLRISGDLTVDGNLTYNSLNTPTGNFSNSVITPNLTANGALVINSGSSGDVAIDSGANSAYVKLGTEKAAGVSISRAGGTTDIAGSLNVDESADFAGPVTMNFATAQNIRVTNDLKIDNASATTAVDSAIQITNSGGAGYTNLINTPNFSVTGAGDVAAKNFISKEGSFQMLDASGANVVTIDNGGSANFAGNLNIASASLSGGLNVGGDINVAGLSTFQKLATFIGKTIFRQDVQFDGHVTVAKDGAGYATLRTTENMVHVKFVDKYEHTPVVSATITNGKFMAYTIDNVTDTGFDVKAQAPALEDTTFSWTAVGVNGPQTASNPLPTTP